MADQEIVFRFIADDTELRAALADLEGEFGSVEEAAGEAGEEMGGGLAKGAAGGAAAVTALAGSAKKGASTTRGLTAAVSAVSPAAGKAIRGINGLKTAAMGLGVAAGPIGVVIAALAAGAAAYAYLNNEIEKANGLIAEQQALASGMVDATNALDRTVQKVADEYGVYAGAISNADLKIRDFNRTIDDQTNAVIAQIKASNISTEAQERNIAGLRERVALTKDLNAEIIREEAAQRAAAAADAERAKNASASAAADREATAAAFDRKAAEGELALQINSVGVAVSKTQEQQALQAAFARSAVDDFNASMMAQEEAFSATLTEEANATTRARAASAESVISQTGATAEALAGLLAENHSKAAKRMFQVSKAAGLAEVAIQTARAAAAGFATSGPLGAAAAIAFGATQAAVIASTEPPTAHIGTPAGGGMAPDERMSFGRKVLDTELSTPGAVANSTATQLIDDANNGKLGGGGQVIRAVIGRSHLDDELDRSGRGGTTRYSRQLRTNPHPKPNRGY